MPRDTSGRPGGTVEWYRNSSMMGQRLSDSRSPYQESRASRLVEPTTPTSTSPRRADQPTNLTKRVPEGVFDCVQLEQEDRSSDRESPCDRAKAVSYTHL